MQSYRRRSLVVTEGPNQGAPYPLENTVVTLGRATDNTIVLDSGKVSRHHAQIRLSATDAIVEDLGSTNGTWVNNERISEPRQLTPGDVIRLADYVAFRYVVPQPPESTASVAPNWQQGPPQDPRPVPGQTYDYAQPSPHPYQNSGYAEPSVPSPHPPSYAPPQPVGPVMAYEPQSPAAEQEQPGDQTRPKWLYVVIGLLAILLCLCVVLSIYIWFAPPSFWEWLFELFNIPLPDGYPDYLGYLGSLQLG